jgi:hypothetical protein
MYGLFVGLFMTGHQRAIDARRRGHRERYLLWSAAAAACAALGLSVLIALAILFWVVGWWWADLILAYWVGVPLVGAAIATRIAVPLGLPKLAHALARRAAWSGADPGAAALVIAARAAARHQPARADDRALVLALRDARGRVGDAEIAATALIAWADGDAPAARALLASVGELAEAHPAVRELAGEWLAADDASAGRWAAITARATPAWPASPTTFFLEGVAARATGAAHAPTAADLVARWLEAPHRRATWSLLRRAITAPIAAPVDPPSAAPLPAVAPARVAPAPAPPGATTLAHARAAHAAIAVEPVAAAAVAAAATAWDRALADPDTKVAIYQRAVALGAPPDAGERALRTLRQAVAADLAAAAERAGVPLASLADPSSPVLGSAVRIARSTLLTDVELAFGRLADRCLAGADLPACDEWREIVALRAAYDHASAAGGAEVRRLVFVHAHLGFGKLAVRLWNDRGEHVLSHALSAWLATEALAVGDAKAVETHAANARLRLPARPAAKRRA